MRLVWTSMLMCASLLAATSDAQISTNPAGAGLSDDGVAKLDSLIDSFVKRGLVAGGVAAVERHGHLGYFRTFGNRVIQPASPMTPDTIFRIYSMTKPITSVAVMMLHEQGKFELDDPVAKYLPELSDLKVGVESRNSDGTKKLELVAANHQPTIRELLTHTAGFAYGLFPETEVDKMYQEAGLLKNDAPLADKIRTLGTLPLKHQPGEQWDYSIAVDVLGRLVEVLSGQTLDAFFQEHIFTPLKMVDTGFYVPKEKLDRFAEVYELKLFGGLVPSTEDLGRNFLNPPKMLMGGGGLVSTANDYLRFCRMMFNGGELDGARILKPETVTLMTSDHLKGKPISQIGYALGMRGAGFGLGFSVTLEPYIEARGALGEYHWGGAASTIFWIDPKEEMIGIYLIQILPSNFLTALTFKQAVYSAMGLGEE